MSNLNEEQSEEEKKDDNNDIAVQSKSSNGKKNSKISQNIKASKPKQPIIKAMDVPKERDNNEQNEKIEKLSDKQSKVIPKKQEEKGYLGKSKSYIKQKTEALKKKQAEKNKSNLSNIIDLKKYQPQSKVYQKPKIEENKSSVNEKLPCAFCSLPITFQEMQIHHDSCPQAFTCNKCRDIFPIFLKEQHLNVCKPIKKQQFHLKYQGNNHKYEDMDDEQLQLEEFIRHHPEIDPQILRQHFFAEKQNNQESSNIQKTNILESQDNYNQNQQNNEYNGQPEYYDNNNEYEQSQGSKILTGLKNYQIEDLITDFYQKGQNEQQDKCSICTKQKIQGQIIIRLPCFHTFHKQCLVPWIEVKATCPTCKYNLKSE